MTILQWFYLNEVISKYAKSILAYTENKFKEYLLIRWIRQEYLPYIENTPIDIKLRISRQICDPNQKNSDPKSPLLKGVTVVGMMLYWRAEVNIFAN
jgi:hypothetical protein